MESETFTHKLLEKWHETVKLHRYRVLLAIPPPGGITPTTIESLKARAGLRIYDFKESHADRLNAFMVRFQIRSDIVEAAREAAVAVINVEYFYDKWQPAERLAFLKDILRQDGHRGILLIVHCNENLSKIAEDVPSNSRGIIWTP